MNYHYKSINFTKNNKFLINKISNKWVNNDGKII